MSFSTARVNAHMVGHVTAFDISTTELKSPGLDTGKPASMTSTPNSSRALATSIFSTVLSWHPGTCSPSRRVVSNIKSLSLIGKTILILFQIPIFRKNNGNWRNNQAKAGLFRQFPVIVNNSAESPARMCRFDYFIQRHKSAKVDLCPYMRIPRRYIRADSHVKNAAVP